MKTVATSDCQRQATNCQVPVVSSEASQELYSSSASQVTSLSLLPPCGVRYQPPVNQSG